MYTPAQLVRYVNQPHGGVIPLSKFTVETRHDGIFLEYDPSLYVNPLTGMVIRLITRYLATGDMNRSFTESIIGASLLHDNDRCERYLNDAERSLSGKKKFHRVGFKAITDVTKLAAYALVFHDCRTRKSHDTMLKNPYRDSDFPQHKKDIIKVLIERTMSFLDTQDIVAANVRFDGAYTGVISSGTSDYLTTEGLIDLHINHTRPDIYQTLTSLINMRLISHSAHREKSANKRITIFNPCLNNVYTLNISDIPINRIIDIDKCISGG